MTSCHFQSEEADTNQALYIQWGWDDTIGDQTYNGVHQLPFAIVLSLFCLSILCNLSCVFVFVSTAGTLVVLILNSPPAQHSSSNRSALAVVYFIEKSTQNFGPFRLFWRKFTHILVDFYRSEDGTWFSNMPYSNCKRLKCFKTKKMKGMCMFWFAKWRLRGVEEEKKIYIYRQICYF